MKERESVYTYSDGTFTVSFSLICKEENEDLRDLKAIHKLQELTGSIKNFYLDEVVLIK